MVKDNDASTRPAQRVEVFTGTGRRRAWLHGDKVRIVAEIASSEDSVCAVARRHGLSPQQLFGWRRRPRDAEAACANTGGLWSSCPRGTIEHFDRAPAINADYEEAIMKFALRLHTIGPLRPTKRLGVDKVQKHRPRRERA
jgi:hypothetical protein